MKLIALVLFPLLVNVNGNSGQHGYSSDEANEGRKLMAILRTLPGKITRDYVPPAHAEAGLNDLDVDDTDEDIKEPATRLMTDPNSDNGLEPAAERPLQALIAQLKPILNKLVELVSGTCLEEVGHALMTIFQTVMRNIMPPAAMKNPKKS
ncbi:uncharacterized protein LOC107039320 [Diachasma alloeum]|uniref:uncharacterized protein LOC107039320 n=1 Tax=Diachasma alloeum TaxID=454923 RepID=UPI0007381474|nr:uncharacterized protein LOC107039320 [Diachasma alloeum]